MILNTSDLLNVVLVNTFINASIPFSPVNISGLKVNLVFLFLAPTSFSSSGFASSASGTI